MNPHLPLESHLNWLLNHSLQAGALVLLVLAVQWIFRRHLTSRWRFALWWIVLARLLLPFGPQSAVSVFNYFQPMVKFEAPRQTAPVPATPQASRSTAEIFPPASDASQPCRSRSLPFLWLRQAKNIFCNAADS